MNLGSCHATLGETLSAATGYASVKLVQPTRRPSYTNWTGYEIANITHPICVAEEYLEVVS